ncbi:MAG: hypothetical protein ACJ77K_14610 [Bacteroidia bacterium]
MQSILYFVLFLYLPVLTSCNHSANSETQSPAKLSVTLESKKRTFKTDEEICFTVTLTNISSDTLVINRGLLIGYEDGFAAERDICFRIYREDGSRVKITDNDIVDIDGLPVDQRDIKSLAPGNSVQDNVWFTTAYHFHEPGKYKIAGIYQSRAFQYTPEPYIAPVLSKPIEIEIVE